MNQVLDFNKIYPIIHGVMHILYIHKEYHSDLIVFEAKQVRTMAIILLK